MSSQATVGLLRERRQHARSGMKGNLQTMIDAYVALVQREQKNFEPSEEFLSRLEADLRKQLEEH